MHPYKRLAPQSAESLERGESPPGPPATARSTGRTERAEARATAPSARHVFQARLPPELVRPPRVTEGSGTRSANTTGDDSVVSARDIIDRYSAFPTGDILGGMEFTSTSRVASAATSAGVKDTSATDFSFDTTGVTDADLSGSAVDLGDLTGDMSADLSSSSGIYSSPQGTQSPQVAPAPPVPQTPEGVCEGVVPLPSAAPLGLQATMQEVNRSTPSTLASKESNDPAGITLPTPPPTQLPPDSTLSLHFENARKSKDPVAVLSYAQVLIKRALSEQPRSNRTHLDQSHTLLKRAVKLGSIEAQYYLGDAYACGLFSKGKPDQNRALTCFELAAKARHAESAYRTSVCYRKGLGCSRDARKVIKYLDIAAMNGHPVAMMEYGIYCFHGLMGLGDDTNTKKRGIAWLRRATEAATPLSCGAPYELALIYQNGFRDIVIKDVVYAIKLLVRAAALGHAKSAVALGRAYEVGDGVVANEGLSLHFYTLAANLGDPDGMMGVCSWLFVGGEKDGPDYVTAVEWASKAAALGSARGARLLERCYRMGLGCDADEATAAHWANEAARLETLVHTH